MNADEDRKKSVLVARTLAVLAFSIASLASIVVFLTEDRLDVVDYILIIGAPFGLGVIGYFVGLYNDPTSSD